MPHRVDIIAMSGKIGNPPSLACLDTNRFLGWLAATGSFELAHGRLRIDPDQWGSVRWAGVGHSRPSRPAALDWQEPRRCLPDRQEAKIRDDIGPGRSRDTFSP